MFIAFLCIYFNLFKSTNTCGEMNINVMQTVQGSEIAAEFWVSFQSCDQ